MRSPLRWLGGKHHLRNTIRHFYAESGCDRAIDPFVGSGSFLLALMPGKFVASDANPELMNFYAVCRDRWADLADALSEMTDTAECYYEVRSLAPKEAFDRAVRFVYLNRTSYGGIFRVNRMGHYNVPYGGGGRLHLRDMRARLENLYKLLQYGDIGCHGYLATLQGANSDDFVIVDPPYSLSADRPFGRYTADGFSRDDHETLASLLAGLSARGTKVFMTLPRQPAIVGAFPGWLVHAPCVGDTARAGEVIVSNFRVRCTTTDPAPTRITRGRPIPASKAKLTKLLEISDHPKHGVGLNWSIAR